MPYTAVGVWACSTFELRLRLFRVWSAFFVRRGGRCWEGFHEFLKSSSGLVWEG